MLGFYRTLMLRNDKVFSNRDVEKCQGFAERFEMGMLRNVRIFLENRRCGLLPDIQYSFREFYEYVICKCWKMMELLEHCTLRNPKVFIDE